MSILDDDDELFDSFKIEEMLRPAGMDNAWKHYVADELERYNLKGFKNHNRYPKTGIIIPEDMDFSGRLAEYCSDMGIPLFRFDCKAEFRSGDTTSHRNDVTKFYDTLKPHSIVLIEDITSLIDKCESPIINYLIHCWRNPNIDRGTKDDINPEQYMVIWTISKADLSGLGKVWSGWDSFGWLGDYLDTHINEYIHNFIENGGETNETD